MLPSLFSGRAPHIPQAAEAEMQRAGVGVQECTVHVTTLQTEDLKTKVLQASLNFNEQLQSILVKFVPEANDVFTHLKTAAPLLAAELERGLISGLVHDIDAHSAFYHDLANILFSCAEALQNLWLAFQKVQDRLSQLCPEGENKQKYQFDLNDIGHELKQVKSWMQKLRERHAELRQCTDKFDQEEFESIAKFKDRIISGNMFVKECRQARDQKVQEQKDLETKLRNLELEHAEAQADKVAAVRKHSAAKQKLADFQRVAEGLRGDADHWCEQWKTCERVSNELQIQLAQEKKQITDKLLKKRNQITDEEEKGLEQNAQAKLAQLRLLQEKKLQAYGCSTPVTGCHFIICLDKSYSMSAGHPRTKWNALLEAFQAFGSSAQSNQSNHIVSVITFNSKAYSLCEAVPLSSFDPDLLKTEVPCWGTSFEALFRKVTEVAKGHDRSKQVVTLVLTDGLSDSHDQQMAGNLASKLFKDLNQQLFTFVMPFTVDGETTFPEEFMAAVRAGGNGNRLTLKLPDGTETPFFMPATINTVVNCFQTFKQVTLESVEQMIAAVKQFYDDEAKMYEENTQQKLKKLRDNEQELKADAEEDYKDQASLRGKSAAEAKEKWMACIQELESKAPIEMQRNLVEAEEKAQDDVSLASQSEERTLNALSRFQTVFEVSSQHLNDILHDICETILVEDKKDAKQGSITDSNKRMILLILMNQFDRQHQKALAIQKNSIRGFEAVMSWLEDLVVELERPTTKFVQERDVWQALVDYHRQMDETIALRDYHGSFQKMIRCLQNPMDQQPKPESTDPASLISATFSGPHQLICLHQNADDEERAADDDPQETFIRTRIAKLENWYLEVGKLNAIRVNLREDDWEDKRDQVQLKVDEHKELLDSLQQERHQAVSDLKPTKEILRLASFTWTRVVREATIGRELEEIQARVQKFDQIFHDIVSPYMCFISKMYHHSVEQPLSTYLPALTYDSQDLTEVRKSLEFMQVPKDRK